MQSAALRILVPLKKPAAEHTLVRLAATLTASPWDELHLTHIVVPDTDPVPQAQDLLEKAAAMAAEMEVGAIPHLERSQTVTQGIQEAVRRWNCNMMVMGWYGAIEPAAIAQSYNRALAKTIEIDTLILKDRAFRPARRILIPAGGGGNALMGIQIGHDLARVWGADLEVVRIARDPQCQPNDPILQRYCHQLAEDMRLQLRLLDIDAPVTVVPSTEVVPPIVEYAREDDLVILGASNDWLQEGYLAGFIPDEIANQVSCSVLMVRAQTQHEICLSHVLWENTIRLDFHPADKWDAITQLVDTLVEEKQVPVSQRQNILDAALERERKTPTALGHQTAIPHAPMPDIPNIIGALAICPEGIDFEAPGGEPVHYIFLLLTPEQNYRSYIPLLAQIARLVQLGETRNALFNCQTPSELTALIKRHERD